MKDILNSNLAWFEKYRPETIDEVVFEDDIIAEKIKGFVKNKMILGNIISYGDGGTGKSTINRVLYKSIITNRDDIFKLKKGVASITELRSWLMNMSQGSNQRIVVCEEFDRLSKEAQSELKDGLLEHYMPGVAFLVTTNNIHNIDPALLQRFNEKLNFTVFNVDGVYKRMRLILETEKVIFDENDLYTLVQAYSTKGIRDLINALQSGSINGHFVTTNLKGFIGTSGIEEHLIGYIKYFFQVLDSYQAEQVYNVCLLPTSDANINAYYEPMLKIMKEDPSINYEYIFKSLLSDAQIILPLKTVIEKYYQDLKIKPLPHIHLQSCIFECFATIYTIKGGEKRMIH